MKSVFKDSTKIYILLEIQNDRMSFLQIVYRCNIQMILVAVYLTNILIPTGNKIYVAAFA